MPHARPVNLAARQAQIPKPWSPEHILTLNGSHSFKLATFKGSFIWHTHPDTDELFYVVSGGPLQIEIATDPESKHEKDGFETVVVNVGEVFVVEKGWRHRPVTGEAEVGVLLVERVGTVNTGDQEGKGEGKAFTNYVNEKA